VIGRPRRVGMAIMSALLGLALLATSCSPTEGGTPSAPAGMGEVTVFAASSLTDAFGKIGSEIEESGEGKVTHNFGGSQALVTQLSQGARADVLASADARNMEAAVSAGVVETGTQRVLLTNRLVVAVEPGGRAVATLEDLAKPGIKLVLAAESVPAGNYSLQALDKLSENPQYGADFKARVLANVVSREDNVRQVVAKVELGEADAGIVYVTDARGGKVGTVAIPYEYNVIARHMIAPVKGGPNPEGGRRFMEYMLSDEGQQVLEDFGFGGAEEAGR
jgi:molybdate transport system substrate-binding protein